MPRQQQRQLTSGVAEALARPGAMQPSCMHSADQQDSSAGFYGGGNSGYSSGPAGLPQLPHREPLSSRLAAAAHAGYATAAAPANLGGAPLAPLREYAAFTLHSNAMLDSVPEAGESPYAARSPALASAYGAAMSGGHASSTASTVLPGSPLTPASAYAGGSTPLTGVSRLPTPGGMFAQQPSPGGGLSAAGTPGAAGLSGWAGASPLSMLSDAPTPAFSSSLSPAAGSQAGLLGSALRSPLCYASTPQPGYGLGGNEGWLADAPTPHSQLGLQGQYEIRRFR
jgi:hypothetical protein